MKILLRIFLVSCLCLTTLLSAKDLSGEVRIGIGGLYGKRDLTPTNDVTHSGGYLSLSADSIYQRFKMGTIIDFGAGSSSRTNAPFLLYDVLFKVGLNLASYNNPLYVNIGIATSQLYDDTRNETFRFRTIEYVAGVEGNIKAGERLRYEYSADYLYVGGGSYGGIKLDDSSSYGIRASLGFSYQLKEKLFYYVKLRAKYQNITYTANNLIGMVEIGIGGR